MKGKKYIILFMSTVFLLSNIAVASSASKYKDGEYRGESKLIDVRVTIENGLITKIDILEHRGGGDEYLNLVKSLTKQIVRKQSTEVDIITGATASSGGLKKAVNSALKKASQ